MSMTNFRASDMPGNATPTPEADETAVPEAEPKKAPAKTRAKRAPKTETPAPVEAPEVDSSTATVEEETNE